MELEDWIEEGDWPNVCFWRRIRAVLHGYVYLVGIIGIIMRSFGGTGVQNGIGWWVAFSFDGTRGGGTREGGKERTGERVGGHCDALQRVDRVRLIVFLIGTH